MKTQIRPTTMGGVYPPIKSGLVVLAAALVWITCALTLWADITGSISGTVTDSSGSVIPNAAVVALNTETGIKHTTQTNAQGFYSLPILPVGHYDVTIEVKGFKEYRQTGLVLDVNTALRVDAAMEVGAITQEVNVSAAAQHVETSSTQMGEVVGDNKIETVPLNGRSYTDLLALQPGVVPVSAGTYGGTPVSGSLDNGNLSVSGQRESANGFMLNGGNVQEGLWMGTAIIPNLDSIGEFRIITNNADAEYGNYSGGLVNAITKSGTNQFHGDAFDFLRNSDMDSRNFYDPERGTLKQNEFGGTFGGPLKRDRLFFFSDYQGQRQIVGVSSGQVAVPSAAERGGDFSALASSFVTTNASGNTVPTTVNGAYWDGLLSQSLGYPVTNGEPYYTPGCNSANCVFPGAMIPQSVWSPVAKADLSYIPAPNDGAYFSTSAYDQTLRDDKWGSRIDANTGIGLLSGYYFFDNYSLVNPYGGANVPGFASTTNGRAQNFNLGLTKSYGPNKVNEFRINYTRDVNFEGKPSGGVGPSFASQGFTVASGSGSSFNGGIIPLGLSGVVPMQLAEFNIGMSQYGNAQFDNTFQILDNFSIVKGTHTLKFGANGHFDEVDNTSIGASVYTGGFDFNGSETGIDFSDFLIGAPYFYEGGPALPIFTRSKYFGLYGQDSWRAKPNLTLNYGLRWDVSSPWYEQHNEFETLIPGEQSVVFPGAPTGWVFPTDPGVPRTIAPTRYHNFAPRLGLAYAPKASDGFLGKLVGGPGKTSIRASFGIFYTAYEDANNLNVQGDAPYGFYYYSPSPPLLATPFIDRGTGNNEGPRFENIGFPPLNTDARHPDNNVNWANFLPISSSPGFWHENVLPYTEHWSFSLQRELSSNTLFSISYVGSEAHHLVGAEESNPSNPALCLSLSQYAGAVAGIPGVVPGTQTCGPNAETGLFYPAAGGTVSVRQPFGPDFGSNDYVMSLANSAYNALEVTMRHTSAAGEFLAGYTYSKSLDNSSSNGNNGAPTGGDMVNFMNPDLSRALSAFDMTHIFVLSYSYHVPFQKLWKANRLTNGWVITGITRFSSGLPVSMEEYDDRSLLGTTSAGGVGVLDVPNYTPGNLKITNPRLGNASAGTDPYFNTSSFSEENLGQLGDANHRFFHGPGLNNWDLALIKDLRLTESKRLEFRGEFFNVLQ
ncbi:MAG: carboxypeptidase regulatory-like domain-containing protein [Terriglobia bacterium]